MNTEDNDRSVKEKPPTRSGKLQAEHVQDVAEEVSTNVIETSDRNPRKLDDMSEWKLSSFKKVNLQ